MPRSSLLLVLLGVVACDPPAPALRPPGTRVPLSAACDALDETRCLLPWPSNTFTVVDPTSETGLRVSITGLSLPVREASGPLQRLDGFSVITPLAIGFPGPVAPGVVGSSTALRLFSAQPGETFGEEIPLAVQLVADGASPETLVLGWPRRPLRFSTDYVAVALDELRPEPGGQFEVPRPVQVALGLVSPKDDAERARFAYHAPARAVLDRAGLDPTHVLRVWDFTTRSMTNHARPLEAMRARSLSAPLTVEVTSAAPLGDGGVELEGRVMGLPRFLTDAGVLAFDDEGTPIAAGVQEVPFRAALPGGTGPLPVVLFGHGTGSSVEDPDLDADLLATGAGKLNLEFEGWTRASVPSTFAGFLKPLSGAEHAAAGLAQSLVNASALAAALEGPLGGALTATLVAGRSNPAAGRVIDASRLAWLGSSLGGTMGYTFVHLEPRVRAAVLNVPGAGFSQFLLVAEQWQQLDAVFALTTPSGIDRALALTISQSSWDLIDGAAWSAHEAPPRSLLVQESIGDPVLPNVGTELLAASSGAVQVSRVLREVAGVKPATVAMSRPALTQFQVPASVTDSGEVHAFLTRDTPAGVAAREQLRHFLSTTWAGAPTVIEPPTCTANGDRGCDFR